MAKVTNEQVKDIADMVRIALSDDEAGVYANELSSIITYTDKLKQLNTDDVEPTTHGGLNMRNVLRKDIAERSITQEEALQNAPDKQEAHFKVPSIMD